MRHDAALRRRALRRLGRFATGLWIGLAGLGAARGDTLECDGLRRLSDNVLLDLQIRMTFDPAKHRYRRYENTGRGWELVGGIGRFSLGPGARILLDQNRYVTQYFERLSGSYYYIDRSGATLSLWGHCAQSVPPTPLF